AGREREIDLQAVFAEEHAVERSSRLEVEERDRALVLDQVPGPVFDDVLEASRAGDAEGQIDVRERVGGSGGERPHQRGRADARIAARALDEGSEETGSRIGGEHD